MNVHVCGYKDAPKNGLVINTTSKSDNWSKGLSPFFLGPVKLYDSYVSKNMENAWQFAKVHDQHIDGDGQLSLDYFSWAQKGWNSEWAYRYPMGKGAIPKYSYWDGQELDYISARKKIYIPLYMLAVVNTEAFSRLREIASKEEIWLWDFDGYDYQKDGMTLDDVVNNPNKKMGHAFVLSMMLQ